MSEWIEHADWWLREVADDPIYRLDVLPLATDLMGERGGTILDLGCGEGQLMRACGQQAVGCDVSLDLLMAACAAGPVFRVCLPDLACLRENCVTGAYAVMVLEHLEDLQLFGSAARVVQSGGALVVVMNHPAFTAESAGPIMDTDDGEFLWRWGNYFAEGVQRMPAGNKSVDVTFYHRPLGSILNAAADAGWMLERLVEAGFSESAIASQPGYAGQEQMPRLLGARWINTQGSGG